MMNIFTKSAENYFKNLLLQADVIINGDRPWDICITNRRTYSRILLKGSLGLGESYLDKWWECEKLDQFFFRILRSKLHQKKIRDLSSLFNTCKARIFNHQNRRRAFTVGEHHYDAGNDLFQLMLGKNMVYSCGYWKSACDLEQSQHDKLDLICRKLKLTKGMRLLDIGCGWGSLVCHAARHYGVKAVGITVSKEQVRFGQEKCAGLPIEIRLQDYREISGQFDAISSVGMFEHVGLRNYSQFFKVVKKCLDKHGLFLLQTIASNRSGIICDPWFDKYVFPNGMLPSLAQMSDAVEGVFLMEDWHNLGIDYDRTLMSWYNNFESSWNVLRKKYSQRFYRMWRYYLLSLAGAFRARHLQVWQIVFSPLGDVKGYGSIRCHNCFVQSNSTLTRITSSTLYPEKIES